MSGSLPPPSHTPLIALPAASLDLETTGLNVRRDRVIQVGLVALSGGTVLDAPRINRLVDPGIPIPATASRITGIVDADVAGASGIAEVLAAVAAALDGRVVIGHHIAFDLAVLRHEADRVGATWTDPPALDIGHLVGALTPDLPDMGLETVAGLFGVPIIGRHTALGDSMAVAEVFARLVPRLRDVDIRTLGEAQSLAAQRRDFTLREASAGWHAVPGEMAGESAAPRAVRVDSYLFSRSLREVMSAPPAFIAPTASLLEAAQAMVARRVGALLVGDPAAPPLGIVTERDLLKQIAAAATDGRMAVGSVMTAPVEGLEGDELLYRALARMDHRGIRHLCVTDSRGIAVGVVSQRDLLHHRARAEMVIDDALETASDPAGLALALSRVPSAAEGLVGEGLGGVEVARVISRELRAVTGRAAELAIVRLAEEGRGPPPAPWCLLMLGSGGRGESLLSADQDNAVIHLGLNVDDAWFGAFGALVADFLYEAGIPRCAGGVMAANPTWRGSRLDWLDRIEDWLRRARPEDLLNVDIFFDLRPVAGSAEIGDLLFGDAVTAASRSRPFLGLLAQSVERMVPQFGLFHRPRLDGGRQDLKRDGLLPLVGFARALALRVRSTARATPDRLADAARAGRIGERDAASLVEAHRLLLTLILRQQLIDLRDGVRPSSRVELKRLGREDRDRLRASLKQIAGIAGTVRSVMAG